MEVGFHRAELSIFELITPSHIIITSYNKYIMMWLFCIDPRTFPLDLRPSGNNMFTGHILR